MDGYFYVENNAAIVNVKQCYGIWKLQLPKVFPPLHNADVFMIIY